MKDILKQNRGVSLVSLSIAVIIIIAITGMLIYNSRDGAEIKRLTNMYNDISNLREKILEYYSKYEAIPATQLYTNTSHLEQLKGANDGDDFYVIDLNMIDGLTLNYGEDYEEVKTSDDQDFINSHTNLYIINSNSHNIFYVKGIEYKVNGENKMYYTDEKDPDVEKVNLKYIDGIKIPDGAVYINGDKNTGLIIEKDGIQYKWKELDKEMTSTEGFDVNENEQAEFLKSANSYEGFFAENIEENDIAKKVIYLPLDEQNNWIYHYDKEGIYRDNNGEEVYIPAGFSVSATPSINKVSTGLVIRDDEGNEYVWIQVPKEITIDATTDSEIETALIEYTKEFREDGYEDTWYEGCGLAQADYNTKKSTMLNSIKENGGFYIARYEMGVTKNAPKVSASTGTIDTLIETNGLPVSKRDQYPYNWVTCGQAEQLSERIAPTGRTSSLMFGIQWDLVLKYLNVKGGLSIDDLTSDSTNWGNYRNKELPITSSNAKKSEDNGATYAAITGTKPASSMILTTGASNTASVLNIYDLAGNMMELTLERTSDSGNPCAIIGGDYSNNGSDYPASIRVDISATYSNLYSGFRSSLY